MPQQQSNNTIQKQQERARKSLQEQIKKLQETGFVSFTVTTSSDPKNLRPPQNVPPGALPILRSISVWCGIIESYKGSVTSDISTRLRKIADNEQKRYLAVKRRRDIVVGSIIGIAALSGATWAYLAIKDALDKTHTPATSFEQSETAASSENIRQFESLASTIMGVDNNRRIFTENPDNVATATTAQAVRDLCAFTATHPEVSSTICFLDNDSLLEELRTPAGSDFALGLAQRVNALARN